MHQQLPLTLREAVFEEPQCRLLAGYG